MEIELRSITRHWERLIGQLEFVLRGEVTTDLDEEELAAVSDDVSFRMGQAGEGEVSVEGWVQVPDGWAGIMYGAHTLDAAMAWLERFAAVWGSAPGTLTGGPRKSRPPSDMSPALTALVAYTTTDLAQLPIIDRPKRWSVPPDATDRLVQEATSWAYLRGARHYLSRADVGSRWFEVTGPGVEGALAAAARRTITARMTVATEQARRRRRVELGTRGEATYQVNDDQATWTERLVIARKAMLFDPANTDLAVLTYARGGAGTWANHDTPPPYLDHFAIMEANRPLMASFVPEAYGCMLLTSRHLARARDLSRWQITSFAGDRYLVEAADLEPWYAAPTPDPEVRERARHDLGELILTMDTLEAHIPWPENDRASIATRQQIARYRCQRSGS